jgi:ribonuclease HI
MEETNPEQDIQAPNRYTIQVCQRMRAAAVAPETVAQVYRPDGSFVAGLTLDRLTYLKAAYDSCSGLPALADLRPGTFEEELARLLLHNSPRALKRDSTAQQASAPATLLQVLRTGLGVTKERNVSPLAVHFDTEAFWSSNTRDQLFGASHQAGGIKWTGASLANPPPSATEMDKCLRWAIAASLEDEATLTTLLLPATASSGYARWLGHPNVRILDTLKPEESLAMPADYWYGDPTPSKKRAQDLMIIAIGTPQGFECHMHAERLKSAYASLLNREPLPSNAPTPDVSQQGPINLDGITFKRPRKFELAPAEQACQIPSRNRCRGTQATAEATAEAPAGPTLQQQYPNVHKLKHEDQRTHLYTDGSCLEGPPQRIGAAVYQPETGITHLVDPCGKGPTNTINRAELAGIYAALKHVALTQEDATILTDSLCALQQIRAAIHKPSSMVDSKHRKLLFLIVAQIIARTVAGAQTTLAKVRAHHGLAGNEAADAGAKRVAQGELPDLSITEGNDPYADKYWPTHLAYTDPIHAQQSAEGHRSLPEMLKPVDLSAALQDGTVARRPVNNMFKSLRTVIHPQLRLGSSNRTQYVEFWEQTRDAMLGDISNAMWNSPEVPFPAILNMLKYRYGVLWNKKIAYRFGSPYLIGLDTHPAKNWACPLCGEEDSGGHILGGCKNADIVGLKILRHDDTVIAIGRTILHGNEGAWYTLMDAGKREDNNDVAEEKRIPPFILPNIDDVTRGKREAGMGSSNLGRHTVRFMMLMRVMGGCILSIRRCDVLSTCTGDQGDRWRGLGAPRTGQLYDCLRRVGL